MPIFYCPLTRDVNNLADLIPIGIAIAELEHELGITDTPISDFHRLNDASTVNIIPSLDINDADSADLFVEQVLQCLR
jgi:hypothetical protein